MPDPSQPPPERPTWRPLVRLVYEQAWGLCVAYLCIGLLAEGLRRLGVSGAGAVQEFLDGLPLFAIRESGLLDAYLRSAAVGRLTPFWSRLLLSSITVGAILLQATLLGALLALAWTVSSRRRRAQ